MGGGTLRPPAIARNRQGARRVPAPARGEHRRGQHRLREHVFHRRRPQELEDDVERERVLLAQRDHDSVVGGRRLQLEVEGPAEALAQRQSPGAIDARAERRVDHELHAAAFVEEALRHDARGRRHRAQRGAPGLHVLHRLLRAAAIQAALRRSAIRGALSRDAQSPRAAPTLPATARRVRPGASPRQNGIAGAAPCASSTRTRPGSTRRIRHEVVPSRKTSPAMLSTAKSSSTVPTVVPSGSATTRYCAVSGIAPPEVMAASRAPRRPRSAAVDGVAMQVGAAASARRGDALGEHFEDRVEIVRAPACGTTRRGAPARTARPRRTPRRRTQPPSAAPECRARCAEFPGGPARLGGSRAPARRTRSARRAWWRRGGPWAARPPSGRRGRCAAAPPRWSAASRSGRPGRPCRYRCRARATRWPPRRAVRRP